MGYILYCHDDVPHNITRTEIYSNLGYHVIPCVNEQDFFALSTSILDTITVAVIHKDFGEEASMNLRASDIVTALKNHEPLIRRMYISGEHPRGVREVLAQEADGYYPYTLPPEHKWILAQFDHGYVGPDELLRRGKSVATPMGYLER